MSAARPSLESYIEGDKNLQAANALQAAFRDAKLQLTSSVVDFTSSNFGAPEESDFGDVDYKDPAIVAADVVDRVAFLRKLKFRYLEMNAKDKYVKSIVSDIDDAPFITAEDNKELGLINEEKKARLKVAKESLSEVQHNIRTLAPMVEEDYIQLREATEKAAMLSRKMIDARLALTRLRQRHPHPRFTISQAEQKLGDQVAEMQDLSDQVQDGAKQEHTVKEKTVKGALEVDGLHQKRAEVEKMVERLRTVADDPRLEPLCDWYAASLSVHKSVQNLQSMQAVSQNEVRLTYHIDMPSPAAPHSIVIVLIFAPDTMELGGAHVHGLDELGTDGGDVIDINIQRKDVVGLVQGVLARARDAVRWR